MTDIWARLSSTNKNSLAAGFLVLLLAIAIALGGDSEEKPPGPLEPPPDPIVLVKT